MKRVVIALVVSILILSCTTATAGITGHFISEEDDTFIIILSEPINDRLGGVYIGSGDFLFSLGRDEDNEDSIRILSSIDESDVIVDLQLRYENDDKQAVLVSGDIARFNGEGTLINDQSILAMQDVRFIRQEDMLVSKLQGTRWVRYTMTISGGDRTYPFDGSIIEFFDTDENTGQIPDNELRTYPFTYEVFEDHLILKVLAGDEITEATLKIDSNVLIVTIQNSILYFLPETL